MGAESAVTKRLHRLFVDLQIAGCTFRMERGYTMGTTSIRFWIYLLIIVGTVGPVYMSAPRSADKYMRTEAFQTQLVSTVLSRISNIDNHLRKAEQGITAFEKQIGAIGNLPLTVTAHGLTMIDKDGNAFFVETGIAKRGDKVVFKSPFRHRPTFLIQPSGGVLREENGPVTMREYRRLPQLEMQEYGLNGKHVLFAFLPDERSGVRIRAERYGKTYEWIAIGR